MLCTLPLFGYFVNEELFDIVNLVIIDYYSLISDEVVINNAYVELRGSNSGPQSESSLASDPIFQQIKDRVQTDVRSIS